MKSTILLASSILLSYQFAFSQVQETTIEANNIGEIYFATQEEPIAPSSFGIYDKSGAWYFYNHLGNEIKIKIANSLMSQVMLAKSLGNSIKIRWEDVSGVKTIRSIYLN